MQTTTSLTLDPQYIGTPFARKRQFAVTGRGYRNGSDFEPTSILVVDIEEESLRPLTYPQIQSIAEANLRNDLQQHFGSYLFSVELFHLSPLPPVIEATVFVSAYAYTDYHRLRIAKTFPVRITTWAETMDSVLDAVEEEAKRDLSQFGSLSGYGVDWLTFTMLGG